MTLEWLLGIVSVLLVGAIVQGIRMWSNQQLMGYQMGQAVALIKELRAEVAEMREETRKELRAGAERFKEHTVRLEKLEHTNGV